MKKFLWTLVLVLVIIGSFLLMSGIGNAFNNFPFEQEALAGSVVMMAAFFMAMVLFYARA